MYYILKKLRFSTHMKVWYIAKKIVISSLYFQNGLHIFGPQTGSGSEVVCYSEQCTWFPNFCSISLAKISFSQRKCEQKQKCLFIFAKIFVKIFSPNSFKIFEIV